MMRRSLACVAVWMLTGCPAVTVDRHGRACGTSGECIAPYTCDELTDVCITRGDPCEDEGRVSSCVPDAPGCTERCRVCQDSTWSDCLTFSECEPDTVSCDGPLLVRCDFNGIVNQVTDCGPPGCNASESRCNDCVVDTISCDGAVAQTCSLTGHVTAEEDCALVDSCAAAGACQEGVGCTVSTPTPEGTPCDDGDGDLCDSSCRAGHCDPNAAAVCDDGSECTTDSCDAELGCVATPLDVGSACAGSDTDYCNSSCNAGGQCLDGVPFDCADTNPCTVDSCTNPGVCSHEPGNGGSVCRPAVDACDLAEVCPGDSADCPTDGYTPAGTPCGDPADHECDGPDQCNGDGGCAINPKASGTPCGKQGECANGDTCDGVGGCTDNGIVAPDTPCGDTTTDRFCDRPDSCDGTGTCNSRIPLGQRCNIEAFQTECDPYDTCDATGVCNDNIVPGAPCGNPTDVDCNSADTCTTYGTCGDNIWPMGTACGDPSDTECTDPDTCDLFGGCNNHDVPDNWSCNGGVGYCVSGICYSP